MSKLVSQTNKIFPRSQSDGRKNTGFFSSVAKVDIPAGTKIMIFIDKPKEPAKGKKKVWQAATAEV